MTTRGYQIPNFTYPDTAPEALFPTVVAQARAAEASGFDSVLVMDHFYQLPMLGPPEHEMLECYTTLAALAQHTERVRLGALVTGNTYRNPGLLAKTVTALDVVSGGRAQLGIGAGWFELEHDAFGFEFGTFTDRFEKLEEALAIILPMLAGERPSLDGEHYTVRDVINSPPPLGPIPVMIGGSGERKTLRMVAQYADESNLICTASDVPRKLEALEGHCERLGRDRSEITVSLQRTVFIADTHDEAVAVARAYMAPRGVEIDDDSLAAMAPERIVAGDPDEVGEQLSSLLDLGIDGFTCNLPANGHEVDPVSLLGGVLSRVVD